MPSDSAQIDLPALHPDYLSGVIGVAQYEYEPRGEAYDLIFEQPTANLASRELVVYNPADRQIATSHAAGLLQRPAEQMEQWPGYFSVHETQHAHWKYFLFD